jgi:hypothetical protein
VKPRPAETILIRKQAVRADIRSDNSDISADARAAIANLANAFGLDYEFTTVRPNLLVVVARGIAESGKPNKAMLRTLGAPEAAINYLPDSESWSTGCGAYAFWGSNAHIVYAIVGGDPDMMPALQRCIVTGILNGFGLRSGIKEFVTSPDDYLQYLLLARALARCDQNDTLQGETKHNAYIACTVHQLKAKLIEQ